MSVVEELFEKIKKIGEICSEPADSVAVLELQTRILRVLAGKDSEREKIKRSECPYGGIDCAWCTEDCE